MASQTDVLKAIRQVVKDTVLSMNLPSTTKCSIFLGWPSRNQLLKHMQSGQVDITVYPPPHLEKLLPSYPLSPTPYLLSKPAVYLWVGSVGKKHQRQRVGQGGSVDFLLGSSVVGGLPTIGENLVVNVLSKRPWVKNRVANHKVIEGDTFNTIIGSLVDQVNALGVPNLTALADDPMDHVGITLSLATSVGPSDCMDEQIEVRAGAGDVQMVMEVKRQQKIFWVNIWAPSPTLRQLFTDALDATFGLFENTTVSVDGQPNVILLPDGSMGLAYYNSSWPSDEEQIEKVWRQTFALSVEYPTLQVVGGTEIVALEIEGEVLQPPSQSGWGRPEVRQPPLLFKGMVMTDVLHELRKLTVGYDDNQP